MFTVLILPPDWRDRRHSHINYSNHRSRQVDQITTIIDANQDEAWSYSKPRRILLLLMSLSIDADENHIRWRDTIVRGYDADNINQHCHFSSQRDDTGFSALDRNERLGHHRFWWRNSDCRRRYRTTLFHQTPASNWPVNQTLIVDEQCLISSSISDNIAALDWHCQAWSYGV